MNYNTAGYYPNIGPAIAPPGQHMRQQIAPAQLKKTCVVKNPVNLKKSSLAMEKDPVSANIYYIEFDFDALDEVEITIYFVAKEAEDKNTRLPRFTCESKDSAVSRRFPKGMKQHYRSSSSEALNLLSHPLDKLTYKKDADTYPVVIELHAIGAGDFVQSQYTYASLEMDKASNNWSLHTLKQKVQYGEKSYEVQEIYGIEKAGGSSESLGDDLSSGRECVICLSEERDTAVLPCRHMCLCNGCANIMRMQSNKCPICRQPVSSLLQISVQDRKRTSPKKGKGASSSSSSSAAAAPS